jgi:hypothetical protein
VLRPRISRERSTSASDEFGERLLRLGASDDMPRVMPLFAPLLFEVLPHLLEQQCLDAHHRSAVVTGDHAGKLHSLGPQLLARDQMVQQTDAIGLFGFDARSGRSLAQLRFLKNLLLDRGRVSFWQAAISQ